MSGDRLSQAKKRIEAALDGGVPLLYQEDRMARRKEAEDALDALVEIAKAAEDWLDNDHLPGGGRMRRKERLRSALARLDSGANE